MVFSKSTVLFSDLDCVCVYVLSSAGTDSARKDDAELVLLFFFFLLF